MQAVQSNQRFQRSNPCPICGGSDSDPRGKGRRCSGYLSTDGQYAHCTREEYAVNISPSTASPPTFAHHLVGTCRCGV